LDLRLAQVTVEYDREESRHSFTELLPSLSLMVRAMDAAFFDHSTVV